MNRLCRIIVAFHLVAAIIAGPAAADVLLTPEEISRTLTHGPWPPAVGPDPSNRVSGNAAAIAFGEQLFHDPDLSRDGSISCATCHVPARGFSEDRPRAMGRVALDRNTPSLMNVGTHRWFGWAGDSDNLWAQSLLPILNADELASDAQSLKTMMADGPYASTYAQLFGPSSDHASETVLVNIAKALAAYKETLITGQTSFDRFRDALELGDMARAADYPESAQRGLQIFLGKGNCAFCHTGPAFTNGEFHDAGVPYFIEPGRVDPGRHGGLKALLESPFTLDGAFTDDPGKRGAWAVRNVRRTHLDFGKFRVPSLRGASRTAPYMHDGSLPDLESVVAHYNTIDMERLHADGEAILMPLNLSDDEVDDLLAFLRSLSDDQPVAD
ncbi:cytochrome-c peroxidase [Hoeflea poritis]|uniref:C-type cytochrome n=1 Tax=Hoeflea poritis TaxID=2993659 RepID=A0ABT4VPG6_9HYPH|nr:cytochrome c peroxidase [Hoeflea poritis]MDA4846604.1 c-type cytochrome [Hoeflea poritis]